MCNEHVGNVYQYCDSVISEKACAACVHWITMGSTLRGIVLFLTSTMLQCWLFWLFL